MRGATSKITRSARRQVRARVTRTAGAAASVACEDWLIERLNDPREAVDYLKAAIDESDQAVWMLTLRQVAHAQGGVAKVARRAKLTRSRAP